MVISALRLSDPHPAHTNGPRVMGVLVHGYRSVLRCYHAPQTIQTSFQVVHLGSAAHQGEATRRPSPPQSATVGSRSLGRVR
jgi:hypothetical protein